MSVNMFTEHNARVAVVFCTPMAKVTGPHGDLIFDPISPLWHRARMGLHMPTNINITEISADGMEVGIARSHVAARCLEAKPRPEFLFFTDSDVIVPYDAFTKLFFRARCFPDYDIFAGVYCLKNPSVPDPLIYTENGMGAYWDWAVGDILTTDAHQIGAVHMGCTLIRCSLFQKLKDAGLVHGDGTNDDDEPFFHTGNFREDKNGAVLHRQGSEDIYFCYKARKAGAKILVDTSVLAGHHDKSTGVTYGLPPFALNSPATRAKWLKSLDGSGKSPDRAEAEKAGLRLALDIGAGGDRREWDGHVTYTTDIRPGAGVDYVQDTRLLNFPDNHWDLTASSHHLEHIGRWDQERVWKEIFRITRPGGVTEHIVPNIQWAAEKLIEGDPDVHVYNVLYGAQEAHGYKREYNLHFFGYTPNVAKALAEAAGFVDVTTESFKERPELGYNLIIRGVKPHEVPTPEPTAEEDGTLVVEAAEPEPHHNGTHVEEAAEEEVPISG